MTPAPAAPKGLDLKPGTPVLILRAQQYGDEAVAALLGGDEGVAAISTPVVPQVEIEACVERVDDELLWLVGARASFEPGERIQLDVSIAMDARYRAVFEVAEATDAYIALSAQGEPVWQRVQQRALVRVDTPDLSVTIRRSVDSELAVADSSVESAGKRHRMIDLSAGGMRIQANSRFEVDQELICDFKLPDQPPYSVASRVVRIEPKRNLVSLKFTSASESFFSEILRWSFREGVREHRRTLKNGKPGKSSP